MGFKYSKDTFAMLLANLNQNPLTRDKNCVLYRVLNYEVLGQLKTTVEGRRNEYIIKSHYPCRWLTSNQIPLRSEKKCIL